ncbi:hypothetical protein PanWU01x14_242810 [Parasponia andersonii]|uniref:Uncharacterized protein n=1 Tax=Parasponia andersonii TaxID=3476 RepID=A0A2P5BFV1_PARAD|nr:hypothetical protein PanWU01x14_242810 [Parasponia andersonii]
MVLGSSEKETKEIVGEKEREMRSLRGRGIFSLSLVSAVSYGLSLSGARFGQIAVLSGWLVPYAHLLKIALNALSGSEAVSCFLLYSGGRPLGLPTLSCRGKNWTGPSLSREWVPQLPSFSYLMDSYPSSGEIISPFFQFEGYTWLPLANAEARDSMSQNFLNFEVPAVRSSLLSPFLEKLFGSPSIKARLLLFRSYPEQWPQIKIRNYAPSRLGVGFAKEIAMPSRRSHGSPPYQFFITCVLTWRWSFMLTNSPSSPKRVPTLPFTFNCSRDVTFSRACRDQTSNGTPTLGYTSLEGHGAPLGLMESNSKFPQFSCRVSARTAQRPGRDRHLRIFWDCWHIQAALNPQVMNMMSRMDSYIPFPLDTWVITKHLRSRLNASALN